MPSRAHIIFPHEVQFGAGAKRGWMEALQLHLRAWVFEGFEVSISNAAIADVISAILFVVVVVVVVLLLVAVRPVFFCAVLLLDDDGAVLCCPKFFGTFFDRTFGRYSDIMGPVADGGSLFFDCEGAGDGFLDDDPGDMLSEAPLATALLLAM